MREAGEHGSIVTLLCDDGARYQDTYYDNGWVEGEGVEIDPWIDARDEWAETGWWREP